MRVTPRTIVLSVVFIMLIVVALVLSACEDMATAQTESPGVSGAYTSAAQAGGQLTVQAALYQVTLQAAEAQIRQQQETEATQQAERSSEQARQSANATAAAQATDRALRLTEVAVQLAETKQAQQATIQAQATDRSIQATATERAWSATAAAQRAEDLRRETAQAVQATQTRESALATGTRLSAMATATRKAEEREETMATIRDFGIPLVLLAVAAGIIAAIIIGARWIARRPIVYPRSLLGDAEPLAIPQDSGGYAFVDLDRQPGPVLKVLPNGRVEAPLLRSEGQEERTTARDQLVDGMSRPKLGAAIKSDPQAMLPMAPPPTPQVPGLRSVKILRSGDQAVRAGALPPGQWEAIQADWESEKGDD